jgi:hypothetical protein
MRLAPVFQRLSAMGAVAQASVPGVYAWGVTVAPAAWARGSSSVSKVAAVMALFALAAGLVGERFSPARARLVALWGFVLCSALAWSAAPAALAPLRIDAPRGAAGMIGWALFALASAAPAVHRNDDETAIEPAELPPRNGVARGGAAYLLGGAAAAAVLQLIGWRVAGAERALLVRFVAVAAGLALLGAATDVALARHFPRGRASRARRLRRAMALLVVLVMLGFSGVLFALRG